jgi:hypothetical protein
VSFSSSRGNENYADMVDYRARLAKIKQKEAKTIGARGHHLGRK